MRDIFSNRWLPYLLLAPSALLVLAFFVVPAVQSLHLSLYRVHALSGRALYVGLENFTRLLSSDEYLNSLGVTVLFTAFVVLVGIALSLLLAVGASQNIRGFGLYRTLLIWPYALSPAIAGTIWALLADPTIGALTRSLERLGIDFNRLNNPTHAVLFICLAATWKIMGYNTVFFLVGLKHIPRDTHEAAALDGANAWVRFWRITLPLLSPVTLFLVIVNTLYACFETFGLIDITTQGGPGRTTNVLVYKLYSDGFKSASLTGSAAAQSILLLVFVTALTVVQFRVGGKRTFYQ
jgi:sn-glycerol 3-phosphate transport system permease protein